jgi:hypothetical protein
MRIGLCCFFAALVSVPIYADVVFSNLTTPAQDGGITICGTSTDCGKSQTVAAAFTPTSDYSMTEVQVQLFAFEPNASSALNVYLYSDSGGLPGAEIAEIAANIAAPFSGGPNIIDLGTPIDLTSGTEYWLVVGGADPSSVAYWDIGGSSSVPSAVGLSGGSFENDLTQAQQFEIDGTPLSPVPEPCATWLVSALVCAAFRFRARRAETAPGKDYSDRASYKNAPFH